MNTSVAKYELVLDDTMVIDGRMLYRIRALVAIAATSRIEAARKELAETEASV